MIYFDPLIWKDPTISQIQAQAIADKTAGSKITKWGDGSTQVDEEQIGGVNGVDETLMACALYWKEKYPEIYGYANRVTKGGFVR